MNPRSRPARLGLVGLIVIGIALAAAGCERARTIEIDIRYSHFEQAALSVPAGVPIRFVIVNRDPIDHEWIVGDEGVHQRHRTGTEPIHQSRPTEVSIAAGATVETTVTFERPGTLAFICHLPGHEVYGMIGRLTVTGR